MAVTIPAITKPMTSSEKIMLRQLWPPSAYVKSCEQARDPSRQRSIDLPIYVVSSSAQACMQPNGRRTDFGEWTRSVDSKHIGRVRAVTGLLVEWIWSLVRGFTGSVQRRRLLRVTGQRISADDRDLVDRVGSCIEFVIFSRIWRVVFGLWTKRKRIEPRWWR